MIELSVSKKQDQRQLPLIKHHVILDERINTYPTDLELR